MLAPSPSSPQEGPKRSELGAWWRPSQTPPGRQGAPWPVGRHQTSRDAQGPVSTEWVGTELSPAAQMGRPGRASLDAVGPPGRRSRLDEGRCLLPEAGLEPEGAGVPAAHRDLFFEGLGPEGEEEGSALPCDFRVSVPCVRGS